MSRVSTFAAGGPLPPRGVAFEMWRLLRDSILRGEIEPGVRLSEVEIALKDGVSRQPVCEAFIKLADEGHVEIRPQRGSFVNRIRVELVSAARFVREAVEAEIVRLVAASPSTALLAGLDQLLVLQEEAVAQGDPERFAELDKAFHRRLAEAAGEGASWELLQPLKTHMDRVRHLNARRFPLTGLVDQHRAIVEAIRAVNPDQAEDAMRAHLLRILEDLLVVGAELPDFFESTAPRGADRGSS